jgi:serine/threonine protein kinase
MTASAPPGDDSPEARERAEQRTLLMPRRDADVNLKPGARLQEFVVERQLGVGGYSIVYLARDTKLDRRVALKEYMPATLAARTPTGEVAPRLPRFAEFFDKGLASFINEARLLGSFDHPSLVKVYRFWPENGTAYMVMPYYEGITLKRWLSDLGAPPSEKWLRELADPLTTALGSMHEQQCYHRDVAPDNVLMLYDRAAGNYLEQRPRPVLLDFGAARRVIGDATQQLTAILKSGYSPVEQYEGEVSLRQGPWTDVYALCALLYSAIAGKAPQSAVARVVRDDMAPAAQVGRGRYSVPFLAAIDAGLRVRPEDRPQSMAALRAAMDAPTPAAPAIAATPAPLTAAATAAPDLELDLTAPPPVAGKAAVISEPPPRRSARTPWIAIAIGIAVALAVAAGWWTGR